MPPAASCPAAAPRFGPVAGSTARLLPLALVIVLAVAAIYGQTARHEFVNYDDDVYILNNPEVTAGLSWGGLPGRSASTPRTGTR